VAECFISRRPDLFCTRLPASRSAVTPQKRFGILVRLCICRGEVPHPTMRSIDPGRIALRYGVTQSQGEEAGFSHSMTRNQGARA
jgi:hypothetical protein